MRTTFTFDDDKQLVQLARGFIDGGSRISWSDVALRMRSTGHTAVALRQQLQTLYRTWGRDITRFPASFFKPVRRPRGRPPGITLQLRRLASNPTPREAEDAVPPRGAQVVRPLPPAVTGTRATRAASRAAATPPPGACPTPSPPAPSPASPAATPAARVDGPISREARQGPEARVDSAESNEPSRSTEKATDRLTLARPLPEFSSSRAEEAVASMFADVSRAAVGYCGGSSHLNVGEVLPSGVTTLLREIGDVNANNVFFDIGAGLGNVVAQVVLASKVSKAIGVELRADVYRIGREMIVRSPHGRYLTARAVLNCVDITGLPISRLPPYEQATIVFWNNILFEPVTIDFVKRELAEMLHARVIICTAPICPRHREPCFSAFCSSYELFKEINLACSWKAELQRAYFYRSFSSF